MPRILILTTGPSDWQKLLADPDGQWKQGFSARTLSHSWETANGFPPEVALAFQSTNDPLLCELEPILAVPEFKVSLPGGSRASQNDLFVLAKSAAGPVAIMVEGKVSESFGPTLGAWLQDASYGKKRRLRSLLRTLGLDAQPPNSLRYQLLHRAASAIITGEQYRAAAAVVLVHSFSPARDGWADYQVFTGLFGVQAVAGVVQRLGHDSAVPLFGAWIVGDQKFRLC